VVGQTHGDMEILICDNASNDRTQEICLEVAERDERVRYYRSETNRGAAWNFNRAFDKAKGEYFKWAAHDDFFHPTFVERCVEVLERDPKLVLCHADTHQVDALGRFHRHTHTPSRVGADRPSQRFSSLVSEYHQCVMVFGVIRSSVLGSTIKIGGFVGSDWILLNELALCGPFHVIPEVLFWRAEHDQTTGNAYRGADLLEWYDTSKTHRLSVPTIRLAWELIRMVDRRTLSVTQRDECLKVIADFLFYVRCESIRNDLVEFARWALHRNGLRSLTMRVLKGALSQRPALFPAGRPESVL